MNNPRWFPKAVLPMEVPRRYHSTALLLPDGRVWAAGTDGETRMEIYTPDYLLRGVRPAITDTPASIAYGQDFSIALLEPVEISSACFIRLSAVTQIDIAAVNDPNLAPPGHYMLFVLDSNGVPSVAPIIQLVYA